MRRRKQADGEARFVGPVYLFVLPFAVAAVVHRLFGSRMAAVVVPAMGAGMIGFGAVLPAPDVALAGLGVLGFWMVNGLIGMAIGRLSPDGEPVQTDRS